MENHFRDPICVEVTRAGSIESHHQLFAVLMQSDGKIKECWGDPEMFVFPRSAVKPLQALSLIHISEPTRPESIGGAGVGVVKR